MDAAVAGDKTLSNFRDEFREIDKRRLYPIPLCRRQNENWTICSTSCRWSRFPSVNTLPRPVYTLPSRSSIPNAGK